MKKTIPFLNQQTIPYISSFCIPFFTMAIIYLVHGIYWGSSTSPLLGDGFHQYVIFDIALRNILHGAESLFYTFTSGLGLNFYALSSYYLGSFLSPFVYFFNLKNMPDAVYLFTLIKFGLMGLSCFISIKKIYRTLSPLLVLLLSSSYALMSFATSQLEIKTWLDVFILLPLILLGLQHLIQYQKRILYFVSLTFLFIQNYYFGYMMVIFLIFWYFIQISWDFKKRISYFIDFTVVSILAGITSCIMILPTFLDLRTHGETLTPISKLLTEKSWYLDFFAKQFIGSFDTTKYGSIPMIYAGLIPLLLAITFFTIKSITFHVKLAYLFLFVFIIASFYLEPLDLFWQGLHAPNMFLHRYSWTLSILIIFLAAESLVRLHEIQWKQLILSFSIVSSGFLATLILKEHYDFLDSVNFILTFEFLLANLFIFIAYLKKYLSFSIFTTFLLFFTCFELGLNTFYQVDGIAKEWVFAARSSYEKDLTAIDTLVKYSQTTTTDFFRLEKLAIQTGNDSMKYHYNGISQFSSVRNRTTSSTLDKLGFKSAGTNLNLRYQNNSIIMDSLLGIKYNIAQENPQKYGFLAQKYESPLTLYHNQNSLPLAFLTASPYKDVPFTNLTLDNQKHFLNQLSGKDFSYYHRLNPSQQQTSKEVGNRIVAEVAQDSQTSSASVTYTIDVPSHTQLYLTLPNLEFTNESQKLVDLSVNDQSFHYETNNVFPFFNAGYFHEAQTVHLTVTFPHNSSVSFESPEFYALDTLAFQTAINKLKEQPVSVTTKSNTLTIRYTTQNDTSLFLTLPYDKGWSAKQNEQKLAIQKAQDGFMKIEVKQGSGEILLTFVPPGLKEGVMCFTLGSILFLSYHHIRKRKQLTNE